MSDWLSEQRNEAAAQRILDATGELFTRRGAAEVGMNEIARAAGCSRATLYRYFENRDALYTAYADQQTRRIFGEIGGRLADIAAPRRRLVDGALIALHRVRETPALASWFASNAAPIGGAVGSRSDVLQALTRGFLASMGDDRPGVELRARWLIRVLISLLQFPGHDDAEERSMLETFVAPTVGAYCDVWSVGRNHTANIPADTPQTGR